MVIVTWSDVKIRVHTPHNAQIRFGCRGGETPQTNSKGGQVGYDQILYCGFIFQAGTLETLTVAEYPRQSRVWQWQCIGEFLVFAWGFVKNLEGEIVLDVGAVFSIFAHF